MRCAQIARATLRARLGGPGIWVEPWAKSYVVTASACGAKKRMAGSQPATVVANAHRGFKLRIAFVLLLDETKLNARIRAL